MAIDCQDIAPEVLVVDDEPSVRHVLCSVLERRGCAVHPAASAEEALDLLARGLEAHVALVDIVLPGMNGLELLSELSRDHSDTQSVLITSHGSVETAIGAIRRGAYDYLQKPFGDLEQVWTVVQRALEKRRTLLQLRRLTEERAALGAEISRTASKLGTPSRGEPRDRPVADGRPDGPEDPDRDG